MVQGTWYMVGKNGTWYYMLEIEVHMVHGKNGTWYHMLEIHVHMGSEAFLA